MNLSDSNMKSVPTIRPKYIFLAGWFLTSIFILLNCHYDWNVLDASGVVSIESTEKPLRKSIMIVTFMRSGSGMKEHGCSCSFVFAVFNNFNKTRVRVRSCSIFSKTHVRVQHFFKNGVFVFVCV